MFEEYIFGIIFTVSSVTTFLLVGLWVKNEDKLYEEDDDDE
jgi:hypothetical protein